jgi:hypothetical protein
MGDFDPSEVKLGQTIGFYARDAKVRPYPNRADRRRDLFHSFLKSRTDLDRVIVHADSTPDWKDIVPNMFVHTGAPDVKLRQTLAAFQSKSITPIPLVTALDISAVTRSDFRACCFAKHQILAVLSDQDLDRFKCDWVITTLDSVSKNGLRLRDNLGRTHVMREFANQQRQEQQQPPDCAIVIRTSDLSVFVWPTQQYVPFKSNRLSARMQSMVGL